MMTPRFLLTSLRHHGSRRTPGLAPLLRPFASSNVPTGKPRTYSQDSNPSSRLPTIQTCPSPTCDCAPTPDFPDGLEIDHKTNLNGLMPSYAEQVFVCTGEGDWTSKIEERNDGDNLAADLKGMFGRGGEFNDPFHNVSVIYCSFPSGSFLSRDSPPAPSSSSSTPPPLRSAPDASVYLLPSFKYIPILARSPESSRASALQALAKGFLLPTTLHPQHESLSSPEHRDRLTRKETYQSLLPGVRDVKDVLVLICGHGGRDKRCGIMGPVLQREFEEKLGDSGMRVLRGAVRIREEEEQEQKGKGEGEECTIPEATARVGLISHIGGHKYAGNVILYIPPKARLASGVDHPLAGLGVWYGRVEPRHVEGIVRETVGKGNVVREFFRGAVNQDREVLKL